jgi:Tol biopolymer transport system component
MQPIPERRRWPIVLGIVVLVALAAAGVAYAAWRMAGSPAPTALTPGGSSSGSAIATGSSPASTGSPDATSSSAATSPVPGSSASTSALGKGSNTTPGTTPSKPLARARVIAYRRDGALWVADDTGGDRRKVVAGAGEGPFALSPDGTRLAWVDPEAQFLSIFDVATGKETTVGPAENRAPAWAPDGAWLAYTGLLKDARVVMRVGRDGSMRTTLAAGYAPQVSADSKSVYFLQTGQDMGGPLVRTEAAVGGRPVTVVVSQLVSAFALSDKVLAYTTGQGAGATIQLATLDGGSPSRLVGAPKDTSASGYGSLTLSPDSAMLFFARTGDDGYSRMAVVPLGGGSPKDLSSRKDDYPMGWTVDSARIVFVSGNAFQGEKTDVVSVTPNGTQRTVLVAGAGL